MILHEMKKLSEMTFDEAMDLLEKKIALLEKEENADNEKLYKEAVALKDYCSKLLAKEREEIKKMAKENNIPLEEIGLSEDE